MSQRRRPAHARRRAGTARIFRISRIVAGIGMLGVVAMTSILPAGPACAGLIGHGPVLLAGYSGDEDASGIARDLVLANVGWRWRWDGADAIDDFVARGGIDFSWSVEPLVGGVFGDSAAFEASLLPLLRLAPLEDWHRFFPYFEAGIGVAYTGLRDYGLGSRFQFTDNAGFGVTFGSGEGRHWSVGYRFRHLSHLGIFGDRNEGLNAHFLVVAYE